MEMERRIEYVRDEMIEKCIRDLKYQVEFLEQVYQEDLPADLDCMLCSAGNGLSGIFLDLAFLSQHPSLHHVRKRLKPVGIQRKDAK